MVFLYYRGVLRGTWRTHQKEERILIVSCVALISIIMITSIVILSPLDRRAKEKTFETLEAVLSLSGDINSYYGDNNVIPTDIKDKKFLNDDSVYGTYQWERHF